MDFRARAIPIAALFGEEPELNPHLPVRATIAEADVILGMDVMTRQVHLVFGRDTLAELAASGNEKEVCLLVVSFDHNTKELAQLGELVAALKGRHDLRNAGGS